MTPTAWFWTGVASALLFLAATAALGVLVGRTFKRADRRAGITQDVQDAHADRTTR